MNINPIMLAVNSLNLWQHQKDAIASILKYLKSKSSFAHLVKMPTGTGKTGVFAVLSRIALPEKNFLLVVPSTALKFQCIEEITTDFWKKIDIDPLTLASKTVKGFLPSDVVEELKNVATEKFLYVTTIQGLQSIYKEHKSEYDKLKKYVDYVIFDEGHKEPAFTWSETIRDLEKPTLLFSATPYRNDLRLFNINKDDFFNYSHNQAVADNVLRNLEVRQIITKTESAAEFVTSLLSEYKKLEDEFSKQGIKQPKIIIKCKSRKQIIDIVSALVKNKKRVIGVHHKFSNAGNYLGEVPSPSKQEHFDFFVHQYMLVEGIDNPKFSVLAIFDDFTNSREFVQQVGRILRNPSNKPGLKGYIITRNKKSVLNDWEQYIKFDDELSRKRKLFDISDVLSVNPDVQTLYFSGTFRDLIDLTGLKLHESILFQTKSNLYYNVDGYSLSDLGGRVLNMWEQRDFQILKHDTRPHDATFIVLYINYTNSPLVRKGLFIEQKLAVSIIRLVSNTIFFYDSEFNNPFYDEDGIVKIPSDALLALFNEKIKLTKVNMQNSDLGTTSLRSVERTASSIEDTAPLLGDHMYFLTRVQGIVKDSTKSSRRRYLGIQNSRVSDMTVGRIEYNEFLDWTAEIHKLVSSPIGVVERLQYFLARHAERVDTPKLPDPISILIDCDNGLLDLYVFSGSSGNELLRIDNLCVDIVAGQFVLTVNGTDFDIAIEYQASRKKYILTSEELDEKILSLSTETEAFLSRINSEQAFRIITEKNQCIYAYGNFYNPRLNITSKKQLLDLRNIIYQSSVITSIKSEKGDTLLPVNGGLWHKDSLFGVIGRQAKTYGDTQLENFLSFEYLVCDDLDSEIADFIGLDVVRKRIAFIHAKAGDSSLSASAFHVICGQAMKNLDYLNPFYEKKPQRNINKWKNAWSVAGVGTVKSRIVTKNVSNEKFWNHYQELMRDANIKKEVIILMGNGFDYAEFKKELNKPVEKIKPQVIQLIYLLRSTWSSVSSVGADLKIIC